jgi:hypothetical protein
MNTESHSLQGLLARPRICKVLVEGFEFSRDGAEKDPQLVSAAHKPNWSERQLEISSLDEFDTQGKVQPDAEICIRLARMSALPTHVNTMKNLIPLEEQQAKRQFTQRFTISI